MSDKYDVEAYAKVLRAMADDPFWTVFPQKGLKEMKDFYEHAVADWHFRRGLRAAAEMLQRTKRSLYVVYPNHFPDPDAKEPTDEPR